MPLELAISRSKPARALPEAWRLPLAQLALAWAALLVATRREWAEMAWQWWNASTYNHILLVPAILLWLVRQRRTELARLAPHAWWPALGGMAAGLLAWTIGDEVGINLVSEAGAVMLLQAAVALVLGPRLSAGLLFPLGYMLFLVPFGDEIVAPLQALTARLAVWLCQASGVPAALHGVLIDTPAGRFEVAQACSGVKFLAAMVALGTLVAHLCFRSMRRRTLFLAACVVVPVLANGVRAWGTIYIAQSRGVQFAAGFDHIVYGWIFFAVVMTALLAAAWRFFDRSPDDPLIDAAALEGSPVLEALARLRMNGWVAVAVLAAGPALVAFLAVAPRAP